MDDRVEQYLSRIGYEGPLDGSLTALSDIQSCHLHTVPYENLDILAGIPLSLEIDDLFDKIVVRRRGGYCFELNALFRWLLLKLGYPVTSFMARFWRDEPNPPPKRRHHVLQVDVQGSPYLCDVGVGGIVPRRPIRIAEGCSVLQGEETYRLIKDGYFEWMLQEFVNETWRDLYSFTEEPQLPKDFLMATYWCEHAPESIFTKQEMVAVRTQDGRNTMSGRELRVFRGSTVDGRTLAAETEYKEALAEYFGIVM